MEKVEIKRRYSDAEIKACPNMLEGKENILMIILKPPIDAEKFTENAKSLNLVQDKFLGVIQSNKKLGIYLDTEPRDHAVLTFPEEQKEFILKTFNWIES
jgi:hypothetical protein